MAQVNLGRIGFVNKGSWNIATNYKLNDVVKYGGSTYAAKRPNVGITPPTNGTDTDDWFYFVNNSDYVDKTSNQDITGIKNFTASPKVPEPTGNNDAVNKVYVDDKTIINNFTNKPTPDDTDNFALQEVGGDLKKVSYKNLFDKVSITGNATFNNTTQTIDLTNIGNITLAIGDVIEVTGTTSNNKLFTVESIPNANQIIVNYEHRGTSTPAPSKRLISETINATIKLYNRAKNAPLGQGQGWVNVTGSRGVGITYPNNTNRSIKVSVFGTLSTVTNVIIGQINGIAYQHSDRANANGGAVSLQGFTVPPLKETENYSVVASGSVFTLWTWAELR